MENFQEKDLPYKQFQMLGLSKRDVLDFSANDMDALLSGSRTSIREISIPDEKGKKLDFEAKLSLQRDPDNSVQLILHPVRQELKNDIGLTDKEILKLKNGELINKNIKGDRHLVQLDRDTNEVLMAKTKNINIPLSVNVADREKLLEGRMIQLNSSRGSYKFGIDLTKPNGYTTIKLTDEEEQGIKIKAGGNSIEKEKNSHYIQKALLAGLLINPFIGVYIIANELLWKDKVKYNINDNDLKNLLDGKRTDVKELSQIADELKGKLSLHRNPDNTISFTVHPVEKELKNDIGLTVNEILKLHNGELINKNIDGERHLVQLDRDTNEVLKVKATDIFPNTPTVRSYDLSQEQVTNLLDGKTVDIKFKWGESAQIKIDLGASDKIAINDDHEKLSIIAKGGINELERLIPDKSEKDLFLHRTGLISLYNEYQKAEGTAALNLNDAIKECAEKNAYHLERGYPAEDQMLLLQIAESQNGMNVLFDYYKGNEQKISNFIYRNKITEQFDNVYKSLMESRGETTAETYEKDALFRQAASERFNLTQTNEMKMQNEADAKLMTQISNRDKDLNLTINAEEIKTDKLAEKLFDEEKKIEFDRLNPGVDDVIQTDANRAEFQDYINKIENNNSEEIISTGGRKI